MSDRRTDISRWQAKIDLIRREAPDVLLRNILWAVQEVNIKTVANLAGPRYGYEYFTTRKDTKEGKGKVSGIRPKRGPATNAGTLPVPRVSGFLHQSIAPPKQLLPFLYCVYQDKDKAKWGKWVHDGTKNKDNTTRMEPRRYLWQAVQDLKPKINEKWKTEFLQAIQAIGRK